MGNPVAYGRQKFEVRRPLVRLAGVLLQKPDQLG
jgi:hypothetical protein